MIISVLERTTEIGLRRSLGATRANIAKQFLTESLVLSTIGGALGLLLGIVGTAIYAHAQALPVRIPATAAIGALGAAIAVGALAGLYPALRAARLTPTDALRSR
jgi:putative ABC transport system permease protein